MELFKVTCVTCQAKLSVRNRKVLGQIVACPRCNSMVHVAPPGGVQPVSSEQPATSSEQPAAEPAEQPAELGATEIPPEAASAEQDDMAAEALQAAGAIAKYKWLAWTLAGFVVGSAIGGAVFLFRGDSGASGQGSSAVVSSTPPSENVAPKPSIEIADRPKQQQTKPSENLTAASNATKDSTPDVNNTGEMTPDEPVLPAPPEKTSTKVATATADPTPRVAAKFDALELDPEGLDLTALSTAKSSANRDPAEATSSSEVPAFTEEEPRNNIKPVEPSTMPAVRRSPESQQEMHARDAKQQLAQRLPVLQVRQMPLGDFLALIAGIGGVPISVAPEHLQMAGITPRKKVSLEANDVRLEEALDRVLEPLHLEFVVRDSQVVVLRQGATKIRKIEYPLKDLLSPTTSVEDLVGWIEKFVSEAIPQSADHPATLRTSSSSLQIEATQQFQYRVLIFLERLRLARKLSPRSRFPVERLAGAPASAILADRLRAPTTFTFSHYTPVSEIVRYWQQELDIPFLVDWPALAELDLWPDSRIACAIENQPWQLALEKILEPLGLGWRAVAGGAIEITSAEKVQTELQLELYQLRRELGNDTERVLRELRDIATKRASAIVYDPAGQVLIVLQPASAQRLIYRWLVDEQLTDQNGRTMDYIARPSRSESNNPP